MERKPLSVHTFEEAEVERWRQMAPAQKLELVAELSRAAAERTLAEIRECYPAASPRELFLRYALLTLGPELARAAYPEITELGLE